MVSVILKLMKMKYYLVTNVILHEKNDTNNTKYDKIIPFVSIVSHSSVKYISLVEDQ